jgi:bifunctional non-homologous end joining protein LigD
MIWDRGAWEPETGDVAAALARGELKFRLHGRKLNGAWVLVRTRNRQWLLIKHRDRFVATGGVTVARPRSVVSGRTMAGIARAAGASPRQLALATASDPPRSSRSA